jgi:hypothetical protein
MKHQKFILKGNIDYPKFEKNRTYTIELTDGIDYKDRLQQNTSYKLKLDKSELLFYKNGGIETVKVLYNEDPKNTLKISV